MQDGTRNILLESRRIFKGSLEWQFLTRAHADPGSREPELFESRSLKLLVNVAYVKVDELVMLPVSAFVTGSSQRPSKESITARASKLAPMDGDGSDHAGVEAKRRKVRE